MPIAFAGIIEKSESQLTPVTWCDNTAPSTYIAEIISSFRLTYSADQNSVTWCDNSAPSTFITTT